MNVERHDTQGHVGQLGTGRWDRLLYGGWEGVPVRVTAAIACPTCGHLFCLANHAIGADGSVSPSVVCPFGCSFHVQMRLLGWSTT